MTCDKTFKLSFRKAIKPHLICVDLTLNFKLLIKTNINLECSFEHFILAMKTGIFIYNTFMKNNCTEIKSISY